MKLDNIKEYLESLEQPEFLYLAAQGFCKVPLDVFGDTELSLAHFVVSRILYLGRHKPELVPYGILWDISKLYVGFTRPLGKPLYERTYEVLLNHFDLPQLSEAQMVMVYSFDGWFDDNKMKDLLDESMEIIGFMTPSVRTLAQLFRENLNGNNCTSG